MRCCILLALLCLPACDLVLPLGNARDSGAEDQQRDLWPGSDQLAADTRPPTTDAAQLPTGDGQTLPDDATQTTFDTGLLPSTDGQTSPDDATQTTTDTALISQDGQVSPGDASSPVSDATTSTDVGGADQAVAPSCLAKTLVPGASPVPANNWQVEDGCAPDSSNNLICAMNQDGSAYLVKQLDIPVGCGVAILLSGAFSKGELVATLYGGSCNSNGSCAGAPQIGALTLNNLSGAVTLHWPALQIQGQSILTIRLHRPAGMMVGTLKLSYVKVSTE